MKFRNLFFLALCIFSIGCYSIQQPAAVPTNSQAQDITPEQSSEKPIDFPVNPVEMPKAINVSRQEKDVELAQKIEETIEKSLFANARWGVFVTSLKDGRVLVAREAQKLFTPASTQKLFTTAVALDRLGADFRWKTAVLSQREIGADGALDGDLILKGSGAPDFDEPDLANLVSQLKQKGLKKINGNIVGDASFFRADALGDGWMWNEAQWYYGAEPSALSYSDNTVLVEIAPAEKTNEPAAVKTSPSAEFVKITNTAKTVEVVENKNHVGVHRGLESNDLQIWGEVARGKTFSARTTMHKPELWAASELKKSLAQNSIVVTGGIRAVDWKTSEIETINFKEQAFVESDFLAEVVKRTNKRSINLNSELMLRTLGHRAREQAEKHNKTALGDDALGALTVKNWLSEKGVALGENEIHDGSGLSRLNFVSPETLGRLLVFAARMKHAQVFKDSLPGAGVDGTMSGRLAKFKDKVFAKTGSITYVNALAGYAQIADDETLAFVIFCNNETSRANSVSTVDAIASLIAGINENREQK